MNARAPRAPEHPSARAPKLTVDWMRLCASFRVQHCAHHWVTDESIAQSLEHLHFDDPAVPHHELTHRANRIASIVLMMEAGVVFDPLRLRFTTTRIRLIDGHHRLRAYQYRKRLDCIPVKVELATTREKKRRSSLPIISILPA